MTNRTRTDVLLMAGFCAFLFFYGLGQFGLIGADEPRYAQVALEMLDRHDWITPTLGVHAWLEKPPFYYWQAMLAFSMFGVSDVAARIPAAFDATLLVIAVYLFFRKFRRGVEVDAALITASSAGVVGYARAASMDMALATTFEIRNSFANSFSNTIWHGFQVICTTIPSRSGTTFRSRHFQLSHGRCS